MRIAIIGAGFSGCALAIDLVRQLPEHDEVCLIGSEALFARGVAYGTTRSEHYLNVRAGDMGLGTAGDFADTLELADHSRDAFVPRQVYGDYLQLRLEEAVAGHSRFHAYREHVISVERIPDGYRIYLADGSDFVAQRVVLAVGALPPQPLPALDSSLVSADAYIGWPWTGNALERIRPDASLLVVGTGLTMADVVCTLDRSGHHGPIEAVSRHGLIPLAHGDKPPRRLDDLPPSLAHAVHGADLRAIVRSLRDLAHVVDDWRSVVDALRPHTQAAWRRLDGTARGRFLRHLRAYWEVHRHRIAPDVAATIERLRREGRLRIRAAHLLHARWHRDRIQALLRPRGGGHSESRDCDVLIRATGLDTDIIKTPHALIAHLREAGLVSADPFGLGLRTTADGEVLDPRGQILPGLYCLGPLQRGDLWEITAVPELRTAAGRLVGRLLDRSSAPARSAANSEDRFCG
jgi:uncharacterized NAD(P)/FAD-binding protein YdhS